MSQQIHILIIDDHPSLASGLASLLEQDPSIHVVGFAENGEEGVYLTEKLHPSVILLDLNMPDETGIQVCSRLKEGHPNIHIIIHTGYDYVPYFNQLLESGASGMLGKSAAPEDIIAMIHAVLRGQTIMPLPLFRQMQLNRSDDVKHYWEMDLTTTEQTILTMVANKERNSAIARKIHVSESSVEKYLRKIYEKLGVRSKGEAIKRVENDARFQRVEL